MKTLIDLFETFRKRGKEEAFVYRTGIRRFTFTYSEFSNSVLQMAAYLQEQGINKGDRVALWAPNSPFWGVAYFGILLAGAIVVPIDFASGKIRAETIIKLSGAKFVIQSNFKFEKLNPSAGRRSPEGDSGLKTVMIEDLSFLLERISLIKKIIHAKPEEIAEIVYTSGTTGDPKGVMLTHQNIVANILDACSHICLPKGRFNFLSVLPLSHMFEQTVGFLIPLYRSDKIIYLRTVKPLAILQALKEENIAIMLVVPRLLSLLKNTIERELTAKGLISLMKFKITRKIIASTVHKKFGRNFQMFASGGAALPLDIFTFWKEIGFKIVEGYGLTECSPIISGNTFEEQIPGSVGKPLKSMKVKLENKELLVKGKNVFSNYYQNPEETEKAFINGWFKTGDFAKIDDKGRLIIKGRKKDVIVNSSGINIYPDEIEAVLNKSEGIKDSCVMGLDKGEGEAVFAVLLLKNSKVNPKTIINKANRELDSLAQIEDFSVWKDYDFPRTTTLKIQKFKVKERLINTKYENIVSKDALISILANISKRSEEEIKETSILTLDLGLNSLSRLELINYLEQEYRVDLEDTIINQNTSVSDLRKLLEKREKIKKKSGLWLWTNSPIGKGIRQILDYVLHIPLSRMFFFSLKVHGLPNLKKLKSPVIFISNHVSYLDQPAIMQALPRNLRYKIATATREEFFFSESKASLVSRLFFPYAMMAFNAFLLPRESGFRKSLAFMGNLVDHNVNILIFPEGTRTRNGKLQDFMSGLGLMVKELQVPVVPIRIIGMEKIYPRGSKYPKKGKCTVIFGKPIEFTTESPSEIVQKSRNAILALRI